ncbi:MAG: SusC/RagA family TonB-linked outer membrane protein [Petrimonas sp.]|uniref:SusC/RagA family TonB-linked outer membrane protein n=1 Tax=Petrimonas sp. TaxID=2023866 RepID=UPI002B3DDD2D|nr:SusC/RagA family TonB-linked outer membrane protein [Petrimonas sp.]
MEKKITFELKNQPLEKGLQLLEQLSGFRFTYSTQQVGIYKEITVEKGTRTIESTLDLLLKSTNLTYKIQGRYVQIMQKNDAEKPVSPFQTGGQGVLSISGVVTDKNDQTLPGVNIRIKHTQKGTVTDTNGQYSLDVSSGDELVFSYIGHKTIEIPVVGRTIINIQLEEDITALSEVIVNAGYYTVKDQLRTGSIARVTAKEIENQPVSNALAAVQGRMAGVNITQGGGAAGGGYDIQIRGTNSLRRAGNYPMYIIDGVPVRSETASNSLSAAILPYTEINPLNAINPNDIESIEILKDADATAIYGSRGANGVILVTTKKGRAARKTALSVNTSYGLSRVTRKMEMMDTPQYLEMRRQAYANDGVTKYPANAYDVNGAWDETRYTDWQDKLNGRTAVNSNVQVSLSGGSEQTGFLVSAGHNEQTTVFGRDFRYKTNNLSMNLNHRSDDNRLMLNASGTFSDQANNLIQTDITNRSILLSPNAPALYKEDGSLNWENNTFTNPLASYESTYDNKNRTFNLNINLSYELFRSFYVKLNSGINQQVFEERVLLPSTMYNPSFGITPANSGITKANQHQFSYLLEPQLNYKRGFGKQEIDILVGGTFQHRQTSALGLFGYGFESNALITNLGAAANVAVNYDTETGYKYAAAFARINYQYEGRYILNLTGRRDGSSRFGTNNRFANFGAIGAAWLFAEEEFFNDIRWLSFGKLRSSYGLTGSDAIGDYQYLDTYTVSSKSYGGIKALYPSRLYNPYFSWEKTTKLEVALELGFINDRIRLNTAWFRNRSGNQLVGIPLPGTTGFSSIQANLSATVENKGLELELNTNPVRTGTFNWSSNFNISFPRNKLVSFPGIEGSTYANQYVVGYPTSIVKVYNYEGIDPETGLYTFTDYNKDGNISSPDDNRVIKKTGPRYYGGWSNQLSYKQWEFSFLFQFVNQVQKNYNSTMPRPGSINNQPTEVLNVWSEDNPGGQYMPYTSGIDTRKNQSHTRFMSSTAAIGDASFIRLKNIQLSYRLPVNRHIRDIRLYAQGQNVLTFTNYFGQDPEFILTGFLPPLKTWSFGIQINF